MRVILTDDQVKALDALTAASKLKKPFLARPERITEPEHEFDKQLQILWVTRLQHHDGVHPFGFPRHAFLRIQDEWDKLPKDDPRKSPEMAKAFAAFIGDEPEEDESETADASKVAPEPAQATSWGSDKPS